MTFTEIAAFDAKQRLPELLRGVQQGQCYRITLRGRPVGLLMACGSGDARAARDAVAAMKAFERIPGVAGEDVAAWIAEGRR